MSRASWGKPRGEEEGVHRARRIPHFYTSSTINLVNTGIFSNQQSKVNHSCGPNCGIRVNETGAHDFVAFRDIRAGEELTFDYAMRNYSVDHFPPRCMCGAPQCRGKITGYKSLPEETPKAYEGFVAPYLLEIDAGEPT